MQITGGSFGVGGSFRILENGNVEMQGAINAEKSRDEIATIDTKTKAESGFGTLGFLLGAPMLAAIGFFVFGGLGAIIGLALAVAGSFYKKKIFEADVVFTDGARITVEGSAREIQNLVQLKQN